MVGRTAIETHGYQCSGTQQNSIKRTLHAWISLSKPACPTKASRARGSRIVLKNMAAETSMECYLNCHVDPYGSEHGGKN